MEDAALENLVTGYCDAWNEADPAKRDAMLAVVWTDDGVYSDPTVQTIGRSDLVAHIGRVLARNPDSRILRTSRADAHHGLLRFTFARITAKGEVLRDGIDFGELSVDGKLRRITGFFGPVAANSLLTHSSLS